MLNKDSTPNRDLLIAAMSAPALIIHPFAEHQFTAFQNSLIALSLLAQRDNKALYKGIEDRVEALVNYAQRGKKYSAKGIFQSAPMRLIKEAHDVFHWLVTAIDFDKLPVEYAQRALIIMRGKSNVNA